MTNNGVKQLLFGLAILPFSLVIVFAAFVFLLLDAALATINTPSPIGQDAGLFVWVALGVGVIGLAVAFFGFGRAD